MRKHECIYNSGGTFRRSSLWLVVSHCRTTRGPKMRHHFASVCVRSGRLMSVVFLAETILALTTATGCLLTGDLISVVATSVALVAIVVEIALNRMGKTVTDLYPLSWSIRTKGTFTNCSAMAKMRLTLLNPVL